MRRVVTCASATLLCIALAACSTTETPATPITTTVIVTETSPTPAETPTTTTPTPGPTRPRFVPRRQTTASTQTTTTRPQTTRARTTPPRTTQPTSTTTSTRRVPTQEAEQARPGEQLRSAIVAGQYSTMYDFLQLTVTDIDRFWSGLYLAAGQPEPFVNVLWPGPGETFPSKCSPDYQFTEMTAAYCPADDTLAIGQVVAQAFWEGDERVRINRRSRAGGVGGLTGDFSLAYIVAHEYAHSLQGHVGILESVDQPNAPVEYPVYKTELHADCWAGVWANSAYYRGALEAGDIEEATTLALHIGNDLEVDVDAGHHGTPEQRYRAFMHGYNEGNAKACEPWLTNNYAVGEL